MTPPAAALEGTLDDLPLEQLLGFLEAGRRTGRVSFGGRHAGIVSVRDGRVCVGLLDEGPTLDELRRRAEDDVDLAERLLDHTLTLLARLLVVDGTPFTFLAGDHGDTDLPALGEGDLLIAARTRAGEWDALRHTIPSEDVAVALRPATGITELRLDPAEWAVVVEADGARGLLEISRRTGMSVFATERAVARLVELGVATVS